MRQKVAQGRRAKELANTSSNYNGPFIGFVVDVFATVPPPLCCGYRSMWRLAGVAGLDTRRMEDARGQNEEKLLIPVS